MSLPVFAELAEALVFAPSRTAKLVLLARWFATTPDPERGIGLAALTGDLVFRAARPGLVRDLAAARTDPTLFRLSLDHVGDLAETVALIWTGRAGANVPPPALSEVIVALEQTPSGELPSLIAGWLDALGASARLALMKLITRGIRAGVSGRIALEALAEWSGHAIEEIEEVWHGVPPPYEALFLWLEGKAARPASLGAPVFRPLMLAHPLDEAEIAMLGPEAWRAEWKWDGIRVQLSAGPGARRIWSRDGEDISGAFPDILSAMDFHGVLDGEMLVMRDGVVASFADVQQRLNRKAPSARLLADQPARVQLHDMLFDGTEDLRSLPFDARRARLDAWYARVGPARMDVSTLLPFADVASLVALRSGAHAAGVEGLMLKRADSAYVAGRVKGLWWKWKRDPLTIDAVLMYARRGQGERAGRYSDVTFGLWRLDERGGEELVPVGKAVLDLADGEQAWLDLWVRDNSVARFGPVREVDKVLVLEICFDAAQLSLRHRSGVALRFPRIARIRRDKPAGEADRLEDLLARAARGPEK